MYEPHDVLLARELGALEADADKAGDKDLSLILRALGYVARVGDERTLSRFAALLGVCSLLMGRGRDPGLGIVQGAFHAISARLTAVPRRVLHVLTLEEALMSLAHFAAQADRLDSEVVSLRRKLAVSESARARAERAAAAAAEGEPTPLTGTLPPPPPSGPRPASSRSPAPSPARPF